MLPHALGIDHVGHARAVTHAGRDAVDAGTALAAHAAAAVGATGFTLALWSAAVWDRSAEAAEDRVRVVAVGLGWYRLVLLGIGWYRMVLIGRVWS